jgi:hypothetical protein
MLFISNSIGLVEFAVAIIFLLLPVVFGFIMILKNKQLSYSDKILWISFLLFFNINVTIASGGYETGTGHVFPPQNQSNKMNKF